MPGACRFRWCGLLGPLGVPGLFRIHSSDGISFRCGELHFSPCRTSRPVGRSDLRPAVEPVPERTSVRGGARTRGVPIGARRYQSTLGRNRTEVASDALHRAILGQVRTRSAALLLSILVRPVLKHGPRSLTCARVIGLCET